MKTIEELIKEKEAKGRLIPACGGTEQPFMCRGYRLLYCWDTGTGKHHYVNLDTDLILSNEEVEAIFNR